MVDGPKKRSWKEVLPEATQRMNETPHGVTGFCPTYLYFGTNKDGSQVSTDRLNDDRKTAIKRMTDQRQRTEKKGRKGVPFIPAVGQLVWVYDSVRMARLDDKFSPFWRGPLYCQR